jgi:ankyrin repeat protein
MVFYEGRVSSRTFGRRLCTKEIETTRRRRLREAPACSWAGLGLPKVQNAAAGDTTIHTRLLGTKYSDITNMLLAASGEEIDPLQFLFCAVPISGRTRIHEASDPTASRKRMFETLVRSTKLDLSYQNPRDGKTVLSWAAASGCVDSVEIILNSGREDDVCRLLGAEPDNAGRSPILYAARWGHTEVLKLLCEQTNFDEKQFRPRFPEDETPLAAAARNGHVDAVELLAIVDPQSIDLRDSNVGMSPLSLAVHSESGGAAVARALLATGQVDVELRSDCGLTALRYAVAFGNVDMIKVLVVEGKADTREVICLENGQPKLLVMPSATWDAPRVLHALTSLIACGQ